MPKQLANCCTPATLGCKSKPETDWKMTLKKPHIAAALGILNRNELRNRQPRQDLTR